MTRSLLPLVAAACVAHSLFAVRDSSAQLISPGRLSTPHAELSGLLDCTQCHELGTPGISEERCLTCHLPLARRIREGTGFHASDSTSTRCASCHAEHYGEDFQLVRFDSTSFAHEAAGYVLDGAHAELQCRTCHVPELVTDRAVRDFKGRNGTLARTYLGLPTVCASCHVGDDPHQDQFAGEACTACHNTEEWHEVPGFDHRATRYPLTGRHAEVACSSCHRAEAAAGTVASRDFIRYAPLGFSTCTACHRDEHAGTMAGACTTCHSTEGWDRVDPGTVEGRFEHESTGFLLEGAHEAAQCGTCHDPEARRSPDLQLSYVAASLTRAFPIPVADDCLACHRDVHEGVFADAPGGPSCTSCHGQQEWLPASYGIARHNLESRFQLADAHLTVACETCHRPAGATLDLSPPFETCATCHQDDDPHANQFADRTCDSCHTAVSFAIPDFDHEATAFPLEGGHEGVECAACHRTEEDPSGSFVRYLPVPAECSDCHMDEPR
jgi:hypothetical protein